MKCITAVNGKRGKSTGVCGGTTASPQESQKGQKDMTPMSIPEKNILSQLIREEPPLKYPLKPMPMAHGPDAQEYDIPEADREEVLRSLYPFMECPALTDTRFDLHESAFFQVKDYRVIREMGRNVLVSPYDPSSGGMVIDWLEREAADGEPCVQVVREK